MLKSGGNEISRQHKAVLTRRELEALRSYKEEGFSRINTVARRGGKSKEMPGIDSALKKNLLQEDVVVYRGINIKPNTMAGKTVTDMGYMSTSLDPSIAAGFAESTGTILRIRIPAGTPTAYMERMVILGKGESEMILGRGTKLKLSSQTKGISVGGKNLQVFDAEIVK